jgi:hypothetical protein
MALLCLQVIQFTHFCHVEHGSFWPKYDFKIAVTHITVSCKKVMGSYDLARYCYILTGLLNCCLFDICDLQGAECQNMDYTVECDTVQFSRQAANAAVWFRNFSSMKIEAACSSVILVCTYRTAQHCTSHECNLHLLSVPRKSWPARQQSTCLSLSVPSSSCSLRPVSILPWMHHSLGLIVQP